MLSPRFRIIALLVLFSLTACNNPTSNMPQPPAEPELTALVVGEASSSFLDVLSDRVDMVQDDGSQKVTDHDLIIFDGDTHTVSALAEHARLAEAVDAGAWVLVADASSSHKQKGILPAVGFATQNDTDAYLFRSVPSDMPVFDILELPPLSVHEAAGAPVTEELRAELQERQYLRFAERVIAKVGTETSPQQLGSCTSPLNLPAGVIFATWCYGSPNHWTMTTVRNAVGGNPLTSSITNPSYVQQLGQNDATFIFTLILNNADSILGDFQTLHVAIKGQATPTTITKNGQPFLLSSSYSPAVVAWPQSKIELSMGPTGSSAAILKPASIFAPETSEADSYTAATALNVQVTRNVATTPTAPSSGINDPETLTLSSSNTQSHSLSNWDQTAELTEENSYDWVFASANPPAGMSAPEGLGGEWFPEWKSANTLSKGLMGYGAEGVWSTDTLSTKTVNFSVRSDQHIVNLASRQDIGDEVGEETFYLVDEKVQQVIQNVVLDLSTVIPTSIPTGDIKLSQSPNTDLYSRLTTVEMPLSEPAKFGYSVKPYVSSDTGAFISSVKKTQRGDTSISFEIDGQDLPPDQVQVRLNFFVGSFGRLYRGFIDTGR